MKIAIDLGHGVSSDRGAVGVIAEETIINNVGSLVIDKLRALGNEVLTVRPSSASSVGNSLEQRVNASNNFGADLYVCIHANAGGGQGTEVFTYNGRELSYARNILNNLVALGFRNRGIKGENFYVINHTNAESLLLEICFVDTQLDVDLYYSLGDEKIADAIVKGITGQTVTISPTINIQHPMQTVAQPSSIQRAKEFVGSRALELQKLLIAKGYDCGVYGADGSFGKGTFESLIQYQKDNPPLVCDGLAGDKTFAKLKEVVKSPTSKNILLIQQLCNFYGANISEDSIWGSQTESAIRSYLPLAGVPYSTKRATLIIQRILGIEEDGIFLYGTKSAVENFQSNQGNLVIDGIVGFNSWKALALS